MTIKRICDKCGAERDECTGTNNSQDQWYDLCKECMSGYDALWKSTLIERDNKLDAWLKSK